MSHPESHPRTGFSSLVEILRWRAEHQPDRLAYRFLADGEVEEATFTYAELDRRARAIGALLQDLNARGERALLLYPASLDYVAAFFGCLYAGTIAVPAYPPRANRPMPRIRAIVADAEATVTLTTSQVFATIERKLDELPDIKALAWRTTDDLDDSALADRWRDPGVDRDTIAFLQYTSGSTAAPKGVMVSQGNLLHNEELIKNACEHDGDTPCVSWLPLYHDLGLIGNMIQSTYVGTPCTLMSPVSFLQSPIRWLRAISKYGGHTSGGPNFAYELCNFKIAPEQREGLDLSSWRVAFNGAEPVRQETLKRFAKIYEPYGFRREALYPCYGLAETTLIVSAGTKHTPHVHGDFRTDELGRNRIVPAAAGEPSRTLVGCGRVLGDLEVAIVDPETLERRAEGQVGEIWVKGGSVAQGYWNRPDVTESTFRAHTADGHGPFLRTGDLGFLWGGEVYITGRQKDLIIIRGTNHYPQDIELTVERAHRALRPGSGAAFSVDVDGDERLVVVQEIQREQRTGDTEEIAAAVRKAVADEHEVQLHALVLLKPGAIPKTTSGKIQRRQSKADFLAGTLDTVGEWRESGAVPTGTAASEAPPAPAASSSREDVLRWLAFRIALAAGVAPSDIAAERAIADYALDSLKAIELMHEIESRTGVSLPMESFFGGLTVGEAVDQMVSGLGTAQAPAELLHLEPAGPESGSFPLSDGQKALWFLWQLEPESAAYNISTAVRIPGALDVAALRSAFQGLVDRHPALRTTFALDGGEPVQVVHESGQVWFSEEDASAWTDDSLRARLAAEANRPFDLEKGPLLRVHLFHRGEGDRALLLTLHHIVSDFWSVAVLARELGVLYAAAHTGQAAELAAPALRFTDVVRWQREALDGAVGESLLGYWKRELGGELPVLDLPADRPRPPVQTYGGDAVSFRLDPELTRKVKALAQERQATLYMVLLAAFDALLARYSGQSDLLVGSPSAGRGRARLAGTVGYFVNPIVLRADLSGDPSFGDFLGRVRRTVLGAFEHQDYPFPTLVERLQPQRDPSRSPVFQVMFALQNAPSLPGAEGKVQDLTAFAVGEEGAEVEIGGLRLRHLPLPQRIAQFDLTLSMGEVGGEISGTLDYNTDLFDAATAERLVRNLRSLIEAVVADPGRRVSELPIVSEEERRRLLSEWNAPAEPAAALPEGALVPDLIALQAERTPGAAAVISGEVRLSYRELQERAGWIAARLRVLGVKPDDRVGLCAERSAELIVGTIGILASGAGYLPLDPEAPAERLASMLRGAGVSILLTQRGLGLSWPEGVRVLFLEDLDGEDVEAAPGLPALPESTACLIYTSGSTGEPKGVLLEHRNLVTLVASFLGSYVPGVGDAVLPLTSVASASFVGEILPPLCAGATVVLPGKGEMLDFERLAHLIAERGVSILSTVPSMVAGLNAIKDRLPKLRLILSGGEALSAGDVDRLLDTAEIVNGYGLTETTICSTVYRLSAADFGSGQTIPIGRPVSGHRLYVLDAGLEPRPAGVPGELFIAGSGLARGYLGNPAATAERFLPDPSASGERMYRTGDLARWRTDGRLEYLGRADQQVKIRGFRIELGEIESVLGVHPEVREAAVVAREDFGEKRLVAYVVPEEGKSATAGDLLAFLKEKLPDYMIPAAFVSLPALPLSANGKLDVKALPVPEQLRPELAAAYVAPRGEVERVIADVWKEALKVDKVGVNDSFFDLGGHSLLMTRVHAKLKEELAAHGVIGGDRELSLIDLFRYPTISSLTRFLAPAEGETTMIDEAKRRAAARRGAAGVGAGGHRETDIAVIAASGRFPGAKTVDHLWRNLLDKVEGITRFTAEELIAAGNDPEIVNSPNYIKAKGIVGDIELFDAAFFGYNPRSAELTDPQHRVFLECAWEALELAGYDGERYPGRIGVYAGQSMNTYWLKNLYYHIDLVASTDSLAAAIGNDKDSLTTEVSYRMNLRGPSVLVQSSSSTGLTAIHYACMALINHECDMTITGGSSIHIPEKAGYFYEEGGTTDPDGHCRAFDADAKGFVSGHGVAVVVLKRLSEALRDGDNVMAVIKGSACNNDGSNKVSYMAPSVDGHAEVVMLAQAAAGVSPETISYVEAHGTGTLLGDPIEVAGLTQGFRAGGATRNQYCAIGSLKTNIGHLDTAAGAAGLVKTVMCLHHKTLPAILHFKKPNPKIDFEHSPFFVNTELRHWETEGGIPRRAGVSSLGMGGTNTHMVLEEAPEQEPSGPSRPWQLLPLSAKTPTALETLTGNLAAWLREHPEVPLADAAYTLQVGRKVLANRRFLVCESHEDGVAALTELDPQRVVTGYREAGERSVAFLFPGQGSQYVDMGRELYESEPVFRREVDRCCEILVEHLDVDLRDVIYPGEGVNLEEAAKRLQQTMYAQPALFVLEYATAKLWMSWGVKPQAMIGHSVGEFTAACLAGVYSVEDGLALVAKRGKLVQSLPPGAMLAVPLAEADVIPLVAGHPDVAVAAINRTDLTVVSGPFEAVDVFRKEMEGRGLECRTVHTSHAFHSAMMDPILPEFIATVRQVKLSAPKIPYFSNVSGTWITAEEATSPEYWAAQLRGAVRFADAVGELLQDPERVLLEVGPSNVLSTAARQHPAKQATHSIINTLRHPKERYSDLAFFLGAAGRLWIAGVEIDSDAFWTGEKRRRVPLPTYPFERQRYWVDPKKPDFAGRRKTATDAADWFWVPAWKRAERPVPFDIAALVGKGNGDATRWLVFMQETPEDTLGPHLVRRLRELGANVSTVEAGSSFERAGDGAWRIDPRNEDDYTALVKDLQGSGLAPRKVVHLWSSGRAESGLDETLDRGYYSLIYLSRTLARELPDADVDLLVVSSGVQEVTGEEELRPERATVLGPAKVIGREMSRLVPRSVDVPMTPPTAPRALAALVDGVLGEISSGAENTDWVVAYRGAHRWTQSFEPVRLEQDAGAARLREGGVYLVTGGLGGIGLAVAEHLARNYRAKLVLAGRSGLPPRAEWEGWLAGHAADADNDRVSRRIRKVLALEELGSEVLVESADSSDREAMQRVKETMLARFGAVHGVLHAAGVPGMGLIQTKTREIAEGVFAPKIRGTRVLAEVFGNQSGDQPLDFLVLFSSVTALLSQPGQSDYAAANSFLDAFARAERLHGGLPVVSIDWDAWQEVGMAVETDVPEELRAWREESLKKGLSPSQGVEALERVLRTGLAQAVVTREDFQAKVDESYRSKSIEELAAEAAQQREIHSRPVLGSAYVAPRNEVEEKLAGIWQDVLGIDRVGVHDNFFDLGGNSLVGLKVISRVKSELSADVTSVSLFEGPTVSAFAKLLQRGQEGEGDEPSTFDDRRSRGAMRRERLRQRRS
jgi:amino acid adenylation domain-containing protein